LGVTHLYLLQTERTVRTSAYRKDRLERIAWEAAKQCGRPHIPQLFDPAPLETVLALPHRWVALDSDGAALGQLKERWTDPPGVLVGPEGGWSEEEKQQFRSRDVPMVSLGPLTLRTETAALVGLFGALMRAGERSGTQRAEKNHKGGDVHDRSTPAGR
ncbi:MAG: RsmE family RNA methyltransferase, partial [Candidatus Hydrothermae bacterium]|nr:RsmE family RNA methyltransferase [Candidatus Hydrothermae bacterium]